MTTPFAAKVCFVSLVSLGLLSSPDAGRAAWPAPATQPASATRPSALVVKDVDGIDRRPFAAGAAKAAVVFFLSHDCPISNGYSPEVNRICQAFGGADQFTFHIVYAYADLPANEARKHARDYGYTVPVLVDTRNTISRTAGASVTPQAVVLSPTGQTLYSGRIDDRWTDFGKGRAEPTVRDLRDALSAVLQGRPVPLPQTRAIGCPIEGSGM